ncbi:TetR/AcrR family transcriptional regulator [Rhodovulum sp. 12E13]|uniref:TetR/AcrR family transcriptional regulator n=1 Tax=Rhodovulum sp. 12E13 TaxID=2203891 RepID=UPI000E153210|nr:TetR/AcrR family transcriptional regulator [Rhodovulum sp. 12E13]RDC69027.1 TetR/AcrR family transcriptional regulator [Rhodovulum sp. 12E13]
MKDAPPPPDLPRERLLTAAQRLFCRYGVQGTGIARVLQEAGVSRKTLYERFRSKDDLLHAVLDREGEEWRAWFAEGLGRAPGPARDRLLAVFDLLEEWFCSDGFYGCAFINAVAEHDKLAPPVADVVARHRRLTDEILIPLAQESGCSEPERLVREMSLLIDGAIVTAMLERSVRPAREARALAALLIDVRCG